MKVLAFYAHPDDETMLAGGTLALLAEAGAQVQINIVTPGEVNEALEYVHLYRQAWSGVAGTLDWLRRFTGPEGGSRG